MRRVLALVLFLLTPGCDVEASLGEHDADPRSVDAGLDAGADASTDASTGSDAPIDASTDTSPDGAAPTCSPPDAGACVTCEAAMCCELYTACALDRMCPCIVDCVLNGHALDACITHCGGPDHGAHAPLEACAQAHCDAVCP